jgi:tetratricopeptide (TPR) repeat protein
MTTRIIPTVIATAILAAVPGFAQTAAELLQKGIYAQETEGKLDDAIQIYRQIVNSAPNPREIGAQAQYRLAQALLQKGDTNGAAQEFSRLARDYSEYSGVISQLARQQPRGNVFYFRAGDGRGGPDGTGGSPSGSWVAEVGWVPNVPGNTVEFDSTKHVTLTRKVSQVIWVNPTAWLRVEGTGPGDNMTYTVALASPNALVKAGMTRATIKLGMEITINGIPAKDGSATVQANTITSEGATIFDRSTLQPTPAQ